MSRSCNDLFIVVLCLFSFFSVGCERNQPVDIKPGEYEGEHCRMSIVDMRFKAQILSPKGKAHHFDSIECMIAWSKKHPGEVKTRWVTNFYHPEKWILFEEAYILKSEKLSSPMGENLSAYASKEDVLRAQKQFGGQILTHKDFL